MTKKKKFELICAKIDREKLRKERAIRDYERQKLYKEKRKPYEKGNELDNGKL